jgi:zinc dependent phospholipase C
MKRCTFRVAVQMLLALALVCPMAEVAHAYSVLTHQAIIDSAWNESIKPILSRRFPTASVAQLKDAHAYCYGGCIIQDMGYYPFGSRFFTDLSHYVRSGALVRNLIDEAQDLNEYAFALGALAHYAADTKGHSIGTNRAVPMLYPKLRAKYGDEVTYEESPASHLKAEFGFDVLQVARGRYAPDAYHDFIGFKVSKPVLERAFKKTYGIEIKDVFANLDLAIGTYRRAVSGLIPELTKVAWQTKKDEIEKGSSGVTRDKFIYTLPRASYEREWGREYDNPGFFAGAMAWLTRIVPKVGPLKALAFKPPNAETERLFIASFNATFESYRALLKDVGSGRLRLENKDLDTGRPTRAGEYELADSTYAKLVSKLAENNFENMTPSLRQDILAFFGNVDRPIAGKKNKHDLRTARRSLDKLRASSQNQSNQ